jgi:hypothetical protein
MEHFLTAQHCLTIAAAFIAVVAACASLISVANNKADSLAKRYREVTKEYRKRSGNQERCKQLQEQIFLFDKRCRKIRRAQYSLFITIGLFITSLAIFIGLGLYIIYFNIADKAVYIIARFPIQGIGFLVALGTGCMFAAIFFLLSEVWDSSKTLGIEARDCVNLDISDTSMAGVPQSSQVAGSTREMPSSVG